MSDTHEHATNDGDGGRHGRGGKPLDGLLVVSLEQAVAAPTCTVRLADAGARVIKVERPEGDFARGYDRLAGGESAYFVWLNRGKQSICLDLADQADRELLAGMIARADILVQNLKPGALERLGFVRDELRRRHRGLVICSITGYGDSGPYAGRKAYDLLIQAESGLASITGGPDAPARVGVSLVDIATGLAAYEAILEALILRARTGDGADLRISMFDTIAEWMSVPLLQHEGGGTPRRIGLAHPSIAPYGVFASMDGVELLISIQSDREWRTLAREVLERPDLAEDPGFATNVERCRRRGDTDRLVADALGRLDAGEATRRLDRAGIAFARVSSLVDLARHPHLRRMMVETPSGSVSCPAPPFAAGPFGPVPALGEHSHALRAEFAPPARGK